MNASAEPKPTNAKLHREDWDFRPVGAYAGCTEEELFDCFEYEYSRQHALIHHRKPRTQFYDDRLQRFYDLFKDHFPATAWLLIPADVRKRNRTQLESEFPEFPCIFRASKASLNQTDIKNEVVDRVGVGRSGIVHVTVVPLAISWQFSNDEIVAAFAKWIEDNQPKKSDQCKIKTSGTDERGVIRASLKALGAQRIIESVGLKRRDDFHKRYATDIRGAPTRLYGTSSSTWREASRVAQKIIDGWLQPMTAFLDEKPSLRGELLAELSEANAKECRKTSLEEWMLRRTTLSVARRFLTRTDEKLEERLKVVCERPPDDAALEILDYKLATHWEGD